MAARIERVPVPEPAQMRRALADRADWVFAGARVVDADVQGYTGVDLLLVDGEGRPVFVDILPSDAVGLPTRAFEHTGWFEQNRRLFLKAYSEDGVVRIEEPVFVFVSPRFQPAVMSAVAAMPGTSIRLVRVECFLIDGAAELLLEDVTPTPVEHVSHTLRRRAQDISGGERSGRVRPGGDSSSSSSRVDESGRRESGDAPEAHVDPRTVIESDAVRALLVLFRSGVDGLDGRIETTETAESIRFTVGEKHLAEVAVSPGSFTVSPGDGLANPIVVSDRVSLERALNSVVSLFVREESPRDGGNGSGGSIELSDEERETLSEIWSEVQAAEGGR
jgi:hypothetical protein